MNEKGDLVSRTLLGEGAIIHALAALIVACAAGIGASIAVMISQALP